jgi:hypothetical protein
MPVTLEVYEKSAPPGDAFVFAKSDEWKADHKTKQLIVGPPGTWSHIDELGIFYRCPKCAVPSMLHPQFSKVESTGRVVPDIRCMTGVSSVTKDQPVCGFASVCYLDKAWGKTLYAIAYLHKQKDANGISAWIPEIQYVQANSQAEALEQMTPCAGAIKGIGVAPAVGFQALDKHGDKAVAMGSIVIAKS